MIEPQFDVLLCIDAHRPQVLVGVGDDDGLVFLEGCQELLLMGGQFSFTCSPMEEASQSFQEVIDAIINLLRW